MSDRDARTFGPLVRAGLLVGSFPLVLGGLAAAGGGFSLPSMFAGFALIALALALSAVWQSLRTAFGGGPDIGVGLNAGFAEREALLAEKETLLTTIKDIKFDHEVGKIDDEDFERMNRTYRSRAKEVLRQLDQDLGPYLDEASKLVAGATGKKGRTAGRSKVGRGKAQSKASRGEASQGKASQGKASQSKASQGKASQGKASQSEASQSEASQSETASEKRQLECGSCGADNDHDALHCDQCGGRLGAAACPSCGTENDPDAKFCKQCATALGAETKPQERGAKKKSKSERRRAAAVAEASSGDADAAEQDEAGADHAADADESDADDEAVTDDSDADEGGADEPDADDSDADEEADADDANDEADADDAQQEARA